MPGLREIGEESDRGRGAHVRFRSRSSDGSAKTLGAKDRSCLLQTIEHKVIPYLLHAHTAPAEGAAESPEQRALGADEVTRITADLTELVASTGQADVDAFMAELEAAHPGQSAAIMQMLAEAARELGAQWERDERSFVDVTIGVGRLQRAMHGVAGHGDESLEECQDGRTVLLALTPGEQHTFGMAMAATLFRRDGWTVIDDLPCGDEALAACVSEQRVDLVGFSLSGEVLIGGLASSIHTVRNASLNRDLRVIVGGKVFADDPERANEVGADAVALDGRDGLCKARALVPGIAAET